jgi:hypothetical protein
LDSFDRNKDENIRALKQRVHMLEERISNLESRVQLNHNCQCQRNVSLLLSQPLPPSVTPPSCVVGEQSTDYIFYQPNQLVTRDKPKEWEQNLEEFARIITRSDWEKRRKELGVYTIHEIQASIVTILRGLTEIPSCKKLQPEETGENLAELPAYSTVPREKHATLIKKPAAFINSAGHLRSRAKHLTNLVYFQELLVTTVCIILLEGNLADDSMDWLMGKYISGGK